MRLPAWLILGWAVTAGGAYALGRWQQASPPEPALVAPARGDAPDAPGATPGATPGRAGEGALGGGSAPAPSGLTAPPAGSGTPGPRLEALPVAPRPAPASPGLPGQLPMAPVRVVPASEPLVLDDVSDHAVAVERLLAYAAAQLAAGPDGHRALYRQMGQLMGRSGRIRALLRDDDNVLLYLWPLMRFAAERDGYMLAMLSTLLETAARDPGFFRDDEGDDILEMFFEGVGPMATAVLDPVQRERLAGLVRAILAQPAEEQPKSLRGVRTELERLLVVWLPKLEGAAALERLRTGAESPREGMALLRRLGPAERAQLDVPALVGPWLASGEVTVAWDAGTLGLSAEEVEALDRWAFKGMGEGTLPEHVVVGWLASTRRSGWPAARPFVERALARGAPVSDAAARLLRHLRVPAADAEGLLAGAAMDAALRERVLRDLAR